MVPLSQPLVTDPSASSKRLAIKLEHQEEAIRNRVCDMLVGDSEIPVDKEKRVAWISDIWERLREKEARQRAEQEGSSLFKMRGLVAQRLKAAKENAKDRSAVTASWSLQKTLIEVDEKERFGKIQEPSSSSRSGMRMGTLRRTIAFFGHTIVPRIPSSFLVIGSSTV